MSRPKTIREVSGKGVILVGNGKEYSLSPMTLNDLAEIESWVVSNEIKRYQEASSVLSKDERIDFLRKAINDMPHGMEFKAIVNEAMDEIDGIRHMLWLSVRHNHPEVTLEEVSGLVRLDNLDEISILIDTASGLSLPEIKKKKRMAKRTIRKMRFLTGLKSLVTFGKSAAGDQTRY